MMLSQLRPLWKSLLMACSQQTVCLKVHRLAECFVTKKSVLNLFLRKTNTFKLFFLCSFTVFNLLP